MSDGSTTLARVVEHIVVTVPAARTFRGVLRLVVGGIGSRCGLSFDDVDELQLAVAAALDSHEPFGETIELDAAIGVEELMVAVGPFLATDDTAAQRVTSVLVDRVRTIDRGEGTWVELAVSMPSLTEAGA